MKRETLLFSCHLVITTPPLAPFFYEFCDNLTAQMPLFFYNSYLRFITHFSFTPFLR